MISPTFLLIHEYEGPVPIYHFDTYRLRDDDEFLRLGPEEYFERLGWTFIEWADRVERCLPSDRLENPHRANRTLVPPIHDLRARRR